MITTELLNSRHLLVPRSRPTTSTLAVRNIMKSYVNSIEGSVSWQWDHVRTRGDLLDNENS